MGDLFPKKYFIVWDNKNSMLIFEVLLILLPTTRDAQNNKISKVSK